MISKDYKQNKEQVLELYEEYINICKDSKRKPDISIVNQADKIKKEIFNLMILGEAKGGKSTFINAYLGKEVLPMDVRECTSAIIKIRKGDNFKLVAKSAAGGKTIVVGDDKIREFLKNHAAISDKYRNIPITSINNELLIKYKGKKIPQNVLNNFLEIEEKNNTFNLDINEYNSLIIAYINEKQKEWGKLITEIDLTYKLPEEMQGITIIDSPGIGASGNVGKVTEEYIKNANAIIFVKSLNGQAINSSAFMSFLRNNCTNREKESVFLVLTGKSNLQGHDFNRLKEQAIEMYKNDINSEKTIFVDSKIQLFLNECKELHTEESIDKFFDDMDEEGNDFAPASKCWLKSKGDIVKFYEKMEELSNFNCVYGTLEKFARVANYIQLIGFLDNLEKEYKRYRGIDSSTLKVAKENINDPVALMDRIKEKENEIESVYVKISEGIGEIYKRYTDNISGEGIIMGEAEKKQAIYEEKLENFLNLPEESITEATFSSMKKITLDAIDDTVDFRREIANRVIEECNRKLIEYTDDPAKIPAEAYNPNFTETDFDKIDEIAKNETSGYDDVQKGLTFKTVERVPYHHLKDHIKLIANSINDRLSTDIIPKMKDNVIEYVTKCVEAYNGKLKEHKKELESEYAKLLDDKENNDKLKERVQILEDNLVSIKASILVVSELKEDLKNYVG